MIALINNKNNRLEGKSSHVKYLFITNFSSHICCSVYWTLWHIKLRWFLSQTPIPCLNPVQCYHLLTFPQTSASRHGKLLMMIFVVSGETTVVTDQYWLFKYCINTWGKKGQLQKAVLVNMKVEVCAWCWQISGDVYQCKGEF